MAYPIADASAIEQSHQYQEPSSHPVRVHMRYLLTIQSRQGFYAKDTLLRNSPSGALRAIFQHDSHRLEVVADAVC